jgi:hypothetical protein
MQHPPQQHPRGASARVLLSSVFGPYAQDDEFGSRSINPMELYHNQVTREQGPFSLRMFHRSWGIIFIQHNISAPCAVLDFPTRERFIEELKAHHYDIVGISSIIVNVASSRDMPHVREPRQLDDRRRRSDGDPGVQRGRCRPHRQGEACRGSVSTG